jgi:hypothetical protein
MGAAIDELTRLENEYMSLFVGYSEYNTQKASFDLVPSAERESQMYVAFRISDTAGPVPSDNLSGKPVVLEIVPPTVAPVAPADPKLAKKAAALQKVNYLIPAVCTVPAAFPALGMDRECREIAYLRRRCNRYPPILVLALLLHYL